jgi:hypothetical protein
VRLLSLKLENSFGKLRQPKKIPDVGSIFSPNFARENGGMRAHVPPNQGQDQIAVLRPNRILLLPLAILVFLNLPIE